MPSMKEPVKIIYRRFINRLLESGLLILAVALGVGAAAAGFALLAHTQEYGRQVLTSPEYREIVVATRGEAEDMTEPAVEKALEDTTALAHADLEAREIVPAVSFAYLSDRTNLRFPNEQMMEQMANRFSGGAQSFDAESQNAETRNADASAGAAGSNLEKARQLASEGENGEAGGDLAGGESADSNAPAPQMPPGEDDRFAQIMENLEAAKSDSSVIIPEVDELGGWEVTPEFFLAWDLNARYGSLFTEGDITSRESVIVLGSNTAELLAGEDSVESLIGRKISSFDGLTTIIGVLEPSETSYDEVFFQPNKDAAAAAGSQGNFRGGGFNAELRFSVDNPADLDQVSTLLTQWFDSQYGEGQVVISNPRAEAERLIARNTGIGVLILFLSLAGLFIASVNVTQILMGRALRMKRHIGILKALGASRMRIVKLFAIEALGVTICGAFVGVLLAIPLSNAMNQALDIGSGSVIYLILGVVLAWILTFLFSVVPSIRGTRVEAAQAMRSV